MTDEHLWIEGRSHFTNSDLAVFIFLLLISLGIGTFIGVKGWKNMTIKDFFIGGRTMHPFPVSLSLIGGVISSLSVMGNATEVYIHGTQLWLNLLGCFYGTLIVIYLVLPVLYPLEIISMVEYFSLRFNSVALRKMGSLAQILDSSFYISLCLYAPSLALSSVTNISTSNSILILGIICTVYITIGGVKAVVYTDVLQTSVMLIGTLTVILLVCFELGGIGRVFQIADEGSRLEFFNLDPSPFTRHTFWSVQVLGMYFLVSVVGISQPQFQRLVSVKDMRSSQSVVLSFYFGLVVLWSLFYLSGLMAYAAYADCDPLSVGRISKADQIIPFLVADKLGRFPGMTGLYVSSVSGAVLSSVSSSASALAALIWEDFLSSWEFFRNHVSFSTMTTIRILTVLTSLLGVGLAFLIGNLGTLFQTIYSINGAVIGPLDGLFITAVSAPWVNEKGAVCGFVAAFIVNAWIAMGQFYYGGGSVPENLPMSTEGCWSKEENSSFPLDLRNDFNVSFFTTSSPNNITQKQAIEESSHLAIYDISYCYFGSIGILIVFIVSSIVSCLTGPHKPGDVDKKLIHPSCYRAYKYVWERKRLK